MSRGFQQNASGEWVPFDDAIRPTRTETMPSSNNTDTATTPSLVERLRSGPHGSPGYGTLLDAYQDYCNEAADEIERLRAVIDRAHIILCDTTFSPGFRVDHANKVLTEKVSVAP